MASLILSVLTVDRFVRLRSLKGVKNYDGKNHLSVFTVTTQLTGYIHIKLIYNEDVKCEGNHPILSIHRGMM